MFHLYLSISCVSSWSFPAAVSVLVFHMPMVMLSLPQMFDDAPVAYLTPPSWCTAEGAVLVDPSGDQSGMVWLLVFITWWVTGKVQPDGAYPSLGRTRGGWVHRGTLLSIWLLFSNYEDIRPVRDSERAGTSYSFQYRSKEPAHCPKYTHHCNSNSQGR